MASDPMPMCPMAETCKGIMEKPVSRTVLLLPGIVFIVLGVLILVEPRLLAWLVGALSILMGIAMLVLASLIRRVGNKFRMAHQS